MANQLGDQYVDLIKTATSQVIEVNLPSEEVIGRLAKKQWETDISIGDEISVPVPGEISYTSYTGGNLGSAQYPSNTNIKIAVNQGGSIRYAINNVRAKQLNALPKDAALPFIKEYAKNAGEKFISAIETSYAALYTKAYFQLGSTGSPIAITPSTSLPFFAQMAAIFKRGRTIDGVKRPSWVDGKMIAIIPPELEGCILASTRFQYTPGGFRDQQKGYMGDLAGWSCYTSDYVNYNSGNGQYNPMFGVEGETLGAVIQKQLTTMHYIHPDNFDDAFKGYGLFGVDRLRIDKLGTATITVAYTG